MLMNWRRRRKEIRVLEAVIKEILASKGNVESGKKLEIMCDKLDALLATAQEAPHFFYSST